MPLTDGATFAGFTIVRLLGSGGMGEVYLARHPRLPRQDALKVLPTAVSAHAEFRERFNREADLAATLWHPHIVGVHDRGEFEDRLWITMDFVEGTDAARLSREQYPDGMPVADVVAIVSAVAEALDYAHEKRLLHRDVKPANILLTAPGDDGSRRILLADFGIARHADDVTGLTATNMTIGSVSYTAPEQLMGEQIDGRADQYALAATAFHLLTGAPPFPHTNPAVVIGRHLNTPPPAVSASKSELSGLDGVLAKALAKSPGDRYENCKAFAATLAQTASGIGGSGPSTRFSSPDLTDAVASEPTVHHQVPPMVVSNWGEAGQHSDAAADEGAPPVDRAAPPAAARATARTPTETKLHRWRRATMAVAAAALVVIAVALVAWHPWSREARTTGPAPRPSAAPTAQTLPNTGPLTGVYSADFGPEIELGSGKVLNPGAVHGTLEIRSACTSGGCVAVADTTSGPAINHKSVFDDVDGQWLSVGTAPSTSPAISVGLNAGCEQGLSPEVWETMLLRPRPDGTLTGQYEVTDANNCNTSRTVNVVRTGDVDVASIDDPTTLPARKPSPAAGFRGHYRYIHSKDGYQPVVVEGEVETRCLRTGDRCMSYFNEPKSAEPFVFADGQWTLHYNAPVSCGAGGPRVPIARSAELDLPASTSDPIELLVGIGREEVSTAVCQTPVETFNVRFERTGD